MSEERIHPTAIIAQGAQLAEDVKVGPFSIIGPNVKIGRGTIIHSNVVIEGHTTIGAENEFYQFCSIGANPQDISYKGEPTEVIIGDKNIFREYVSVHKATTKEEGITKVGNESLFMAKVHIAHDCIVGNNCIITNSVNLAGHVKIGDRCIIGGGTNISQFISLGRGSYIGGASAVNRDVPIFCTAYGNRVKLKGINIVGMRRQGYSRQIIGEVVDFLRAMESSALAPRAFVDHQELMQDFKGNEIIDEMADNIRSSEVGVAPFLS